MSDFKNLFKLIWKRFSIWIMIFAILTVLLNSLGAREQIKRNEENLRDATYYMAKDLKVDFPNIGSRIDQDYLNKADNLYKTYKEKYNIGINEDGSYQYGFDDDDYDYGKIEPINRYRNIKDFIKEDYDYFNNLIVVLLFFLVFISVMITSLEQSFPYYDFTTMLPWKKRDEVWMKALIVFGLGLVLLLIGILTNYLVIKTSIFGNIMNYGNIGSIIAKMALYMLGTSLLVVATGMISGNFLGHFGLLIIAFGGIDLIWQNIRVIIDLFDMDMLYKVDTAYSSLIDKIPSILKPFVSLRFVDNLYPQLFGFILVALLYGILAYLVSQKLSGENAGFMIISKPVEKFAKTLGIISFTSIFYTIVSSILLTNSSIILHLLIYAMGLLIAIKVFGILFKIRLKF